MPPQSQALDSQGWVRYKQRRCSWVRGLGVALLVLGVILVACFDSTANSQAHSHGSDWAGSAIGGTGDGLGTSTDRTASAANQAYPGWDADTNDKPKGRGFVGKQVCPDLVVRTIELDHGRAEHVT
jgi:hypothetical protein